MLPSALGPAKAHQTSDKGVWLPTSMDLGIVYLSTTVATDKSNFRREVAIWTESVRFKIPVYPRSYSWA